MPQQKRSAVVAVLGATILGYALLSSGGHGAPIGTPAQRAAGTGAIQTVSADAPRTLALGRFPPSVARGSSRPMACVADLPLKVRIGQTMLLITDDPAAIRADLRLGRAAGTLAFGTLTEAGARQFRAATRATRYGAILAADEEGGTVQRYRLVAGSLPSAQWQATYLTPGQVRARYRTHGLKLRAWGVDMALAPVVDVGHGPGIGSRSYSSDPRTVARFSAAAAEGYRRAGLLPVLKHFPGLGRASADTHTRASTTPSLASLRRIDLVPYRALLADRPVGVMVAHVSVPGFSDGPASQSRAVITRLLRSKLGDSGLVISDALGMAGTGTSQGRALVRFLRAGGDLGIVTPQGAPAARAAVRAAVRRGSLSEARLNAVTRRVLAHKGVNPCRVPR